MEKYKYKFSVIIPVYNTEQYIAETIESVINQDIGFKKNIQIILVNDGSNDNSKEICLEYQKKYPDNIKYIEQKNAGVSAARNNGMQYIEGKYTNFLDSDDKWNLDAFSKVYKFFEKNYDKINFASCRQKFFEAREDFHMLDYKFEKTGIIDAMKEYSNLQLHITATFVKSEILKNKKYLFDTRLKYTEDSKFITQILLDSNLKYGVIREAIHNYRRRASENSAVQKKSKSVSWYMETPKYSYYEIMNISKEKFGQVIPYVQFYIMYDMQWRLKEDIHSVLSEEQIKKYKEMVIDLLKNIEDYIIVEQRNLTSEYKVCALSLKYGRNIAEELQLVDNMLYFNDLPIFKIKKKSLFNLKLIDIINNTMEIEGEINTFIPVQNYNIYALLNNGETYNLQYLPDETNNRKLFGEVFLKNRRFKISIHISKDVKKINFMINYKNNENNIRKLSISLGKFTRLEKNSYKVQGDFIIKCSKNRVLLIKKNRKTLFRAEVKTLKELLKKCEFKIIFYRLLYRIARRKINGPIWIISDRVKRAGDSGEVLFKYLVENEKNANIYFTISKDCEDYDKMKKYGKVLKYDSIKYKLYFLLADLIISSQANDWVINAFGKKEKYIYDLCKFKFVFLQHGITKDDLSSWLKKYSKNIAVFITSAKREYESIINGNYMYTEKEVKLTGFPRYDILNNKPNNKILFMPTWRKSLEGKGTVGNTEYEYNEEFKNSEYCKFYNKLINDEKILQAIKNNGYTAEFFVHPSFEKQYKDFKGNDLVNIHIGEINYNKEFSEGNLLITDYSSVAFDFAYLKKPVAYLQFDKEEFFSTHLYEKGYYDYDKDGFGPVCYSYEESVENIVNIINSKCKEEEKYEKRVNDFFEYTDKDNCKRVHEELLKLTNA